ncbi:uncharacterized protein HKW66_Vig0002810 [Vigna angularis]|uniref:Uncharacterized protein n=1 Tax=Phaseolus angularis TaxID=3914 RepID=A0A8T0LC13_PHAAN|nr:uncharacterized protein HKW66_Vig0002810 [Vigna angularis]
MPWSRNCVEEATAVAIANYRSFIAAADALIAIRHEVSSIDNHLESLLLQKSKNVDVEDYDRVKKLAIEIQVLKLEDMKMLVVVLLKLWMIWRFLQLMINNEGHGGDDDFNEYEDHVEEDDYPDSVSRLLKDLASHRLQLMEREKRIHDILHDEANLKLDLEKNKKLLAEYKKRIDVLLREKEDAGKENQQLSRQLDEITQGKSSTPDTTSEQVMKEEKDTRIQVHLKL